MAEMPPRVALFGGRGGFLGLPVGGSVPGSPPGGLGPQVLPAPLAVTAAPPRLLPRGPRCPQAGPGVPCAPGGLGPLPSEPGGTRGPAAPARPGRPRRGRFSRATAQESPAVSFSKTGLSRLCPAPPAQEGSDTNFDVFVVYFFGWNPHILACAKRIVRRVTRKRVLLALLYWFAVTQEAPRKQSDRYTSVKPCRCKSRVEAFLEHLGRAALETLQPAGVRGAGQPRPVWLLSTCWDGEPVEHDGGNGWAVPEGLRASALLPRG